MPDEDDPMSGAYGGPGPQDIANGTAVLASALTREAESLATAAAGLRTTFDLFAAEAHGRALREAVGAAAGLSGALLAAARYLLRFTGDPVRAAQETAAGLRRDALSAGEIIGHLRAAALAPTTDDGAARIAAATIAETFAEAFGAAWRTAPPPASDQGD